MYFRCKFRSNILNIFEVNSLYKSSEVYSQTIRFQSNINLTDVKTVPLVYSTYGKAPDVDTKKPIFILHGLYGSKKNWNKVSETISSETKRQVFAIDQRNHGESPHADDFTYYHLAADLLRLLKDLGISHGKCTFIGHSLGGRAAMTLALYEPSVINDLIVVDISPVGVRLNFESHKELVDFLLKLEIPKNLSLLKGRQFVDKKLEKLIANQFTRNFLIMNLAKDEATGTFMWKINLKSISANILSLAEMPKGPHIYNKPVLFVCGENSLFVHRDDHEDIYKLFPKAEIIYIKGAGHVVHAQKPKEFLEAVISFLKKEK